MTQSCAYDLFRFSCLTVCLISPELHQYEKCYYILYEIKFLLFRDDLFGIIFYSASLWANVECNCELNSPRIPDAIA